MTGTKKVALMFPVARMHEGQFVRGVIDYVHEHGRWTFHANPEMFAVSLKTLRGWPGHGVLAPLRTKAQLQVAKELEIPVMALSQLSRQPDRRSGDHRPQLSDLRESGAIEQDADMVVFVFREEIYYPDDPEKKGKAELILAKHRNGETGNVPLIFLGEITSFKNPDPDGFDSAEPPPF